ncbi:hypothetical protein HYR54_07235 [Candidatus Acetothermia bacterium]|nr:hypothetical protein [Candidatus Acetothermia bacterium]
MMIHKVLKQLVALLVVLATGVAAFVSLAPYPVPPDHSQNTIFVVMSLTIPTNVQSGQEAQFCARIINNGNVGGSQLIAFRVNEATLATLEQKLDSQAEADVCFKHTFTAAGTYQITIETENNSKSATVPVK